MPPAAGWKRAKSLPVLRAKYAHKIRNLEAKNAQLISEK